MIRTQISMTEQQAEGLRRLAALRQRSQAALLREALDDLLDGAELERRIELARAAIGRHSSGQHSSGQHHSGQQGIAEDHDAELERAFSS